MPEQKVVRRRQGTVALLGAGCVPALGIADNARTVRLVQRDPVRSELPQGLGRNARSIRERPGGISGPPAAGVSEALRRTPGTERDVRRDVEVPQALQTPPVEVQPSLLDPTGPARLDA